MTDAERAAWSQTQQEYVAALAIARKAWGTDAPADVVQAAAATILIHHGKLAPANGKPATNGKAAPAAGDVPACKKCGGAMWDNRRDKKSPRSPDFKCKDKNCDGAIWLTPPSKKRAPAQSLDEVPEALEQDGDDDLPF